MSTYYTSAALVKDTIALLSGRSQSSLGDSPGSKEGCAAELGDMGICDGRKQELL